MKKKALWEIAHDYANRIECGISHRMTISNAVWVLIRKAFEAGVHWERRRAKRESEKEFKKSPAYALHKALDAAEKAPKRKINLVAKKGAPK